MNSRADCPACGQRVPFFWRGVFQSIRCRACGVQIMHRRITLVWVFFGTANAFYVGAYVFGKTDASVIIPLWFAVGAGCMMLLFVVAPYFLPFKQVSRGPVCRECGYELRGSTGDQCPECGKPIDVPLPHGDNLAP